jgi:hypothetical protein
MQQPRALATSTGPLTFTDIVTRALNTTLRAFRFVEYLPVSTLLCRRLSQIESLLGAGDLRKRLSEMTMRSHWTGRQSIGMVGNRSATGRNRPQGASTEANNNMRIPWGIFVFVI